MAEEDGDRLDTDLDCRSCGKPLFSVEPGRQRTDMYELTHHWGVETFERNAEGVLVMKDFQGAPFELVGKFCCGDCLVSYVRQNIEGGRAGN